MKQQRAIGFLSKFKEARASSSDEQNPRVTVGDNGGPPLDWRQYGGFIVEARDARHHPIVGYGKQVPPADPDRGFCYSVNEAWRDLQHECRFRDGYVMNGGQKMLVERGSLVGAVSWLAHRWNWTPKRVRGFLDRIENDGMIERFTRGPGGDEVGLEKGNQKGNQAAIIRVCNYEKFQSFEGATGQSSGQSTGNQGAIDGQSKGNQGATEGQQYIEEQWNNGTTGQDSNPPTPQGGIAGAEVEVEVDEPEPEPEPKPKPKRKPRGKVKLPTFTDAEIAETDEAVALWNDLADEHGFARVEVVTPDRRIRALKRIAAIGGIENFKVALGAVQHVPFLMGKEPPRAGSREAFKLDFERLLQSEGNLGDVLAKLIDKAGQVKAGGGTAKPQGPWWQDATRVAATSLDRWRELIAEHAGKFWPGVHLGPPPGQPGCIVPKQLIEELKLCERFDERGLQRMGWGK